MGCHHPKPHLTPLIPSPTPNGILRITIEQAHIYPRQSLSSMDPYLRITMSNQQSRGYIHKKAGRGGVFNESFQFVVNSCFKSEGRSLVVELWTKGMINDKMLGMSILDIDPLIRCQENAMRRSRVVGMGRDVQGREDNVGNLNNNSNMLFNNPNNNMANSGYVSNMSNVMNSASNSPNPNSINPIQPIINPTINESTLTRPQQSLPNPINQPLPLNQPLSLPINQPLSNPILPLSTHTKIHLSHNTSQIGYLTTTITFTQQPTTTIGLRFIYASLRRTSSLFTTMHCSVQVIAGEEVLRTQKKTDKDTKNPPSWEEEVLLFNIPQSLKECVVRVLDGEREVGHVKIGLDSQLMSRKGEHVFTEQLEHEKAITGVIKFSLLVGMATAIGMGAGSMKGSRIENQKNEQPFTMTQDRFQQQQQPLYTQMRRQLPQQKSAKFQQTEFTTVLNTQENEEKVTPPKVHRIGDSVVVIDGERVGG